MKYMEYRGHQAAIEYDGEDKIFVGHIAGISEGIGFHGESVAELETAFHDAVDDYLEHRAEKDASFQSLQEPQPFPALLQEAAFPWWA